MTIASGLHGGSLKSTHAGSGLGPVSGRRITAGRSMATAEQMKAPLEQPVEKGLKSGALGLFSTTVVATASVAPAYSIAATLVFVVAAVGLQSPAVTVLAFVPMLLT
jgi:cytochrome c peroxidase